MAEIKDSGGFIFCVQCYVTSRQLVHIFKETHNLLILRNFSEILAFFLLFFLSSELRFKKHRVISHPLEQCQN